MAEQVSSSSEALKKLEDQLTCPICLEHLTNPKTLPCLHSFCQHCLQAVPLDLVESAKYLITCPSCRSSCEVPETGVAGLTTAFLVNNLIEVYGLLKKVSVPGGAVSCDNCEKSNAIRYCKECGLFFCQECLHHHNKLKSNTDHKVLSLDEVANTAYQLPKGDVSMKCSSHDKPLDIYCETCEELVCQHCTVRIHKDHDYDVVSDAYSKHRQALEDSLQPLKKQIVRVTEGLAGLIERREEITRQGEEVKKEIDATIQQIIEQVQERGRKLSEEVGITVEAKVGVVNGQVKQAETTLGQATECLEYIEQCLKVGTPQQVLSSKAQMRDHSQRIVSSVQREMFEPLEKPDVTLMRSKQIGSISSNIGNVQYSLSLKTAKVSKNKLPLVGRESTCTISLFSSDGSPSPVPSSLISCYLSPPDNEQHVECSVKEYQITFTPNTRGLHQIHVRVGGKDIPGSPVSIPVSIPPEKRGTPVNIITGTNKPYGVDVSEDGLVIVSEPSRHCVTIQNKKGEKIRSFGSEGTGKGQFNWPRGVAVTGRGTILIADGLNSRIQQFTMEGRCISCVGKRGKGPLEFNFPYGIAVNKTTGQVFVADYDNYRIQVLNPDLSFSHSFGQYGSGKGQLYCPRDVIVFDSETVYVADSHNHRIQQFTFDGRFVSMFKTSVDYPVSIAADDGVLYVSHDGNDCLTMYTTSGEYIGSIGGKDSATFQFKFPQYLTVDSKGYLYLCDYGQNRVVVL